MALIYCMTGLFGLVVAAAVIDCRTRDKHGAVFFALGCSFGVGAIYFFTLLSETLKW